MLQAHVGMSKPVKIISHILFDVKGFNNKMFEYKNHTKYNNSSNHMKNSHVSTRQYIYKLHEVPLIT